MVVFSEKNVGEYGTRIFCTHKSSHGTRYLWLQVHTFNLEAVLSTNHKKIKRTKTKAMVSFSTWLHIYTSHTQFSTSVKLIDNAVLLEKLFWLKHKMLDEIRGQRRIIKEASILRFFALFSRRIKKQNVETKTINFFGRDECNEEIIFLGLEKRNTSMKNPSKKKKGKKKKTTVRS